LESAADRLGVRKKTAANPRIAKGRTRERHRNTGR
jgi:hypothetical protein